MPIMRVGIDDVFAAVPDPWGGGRAGPLSVDGFRYVDLGEGGTRIAYGAAGRTMLRGSHRAIRAYAESGNTVIVDELMLDEQVYPDWLVALEGIPTLWVAVHAELAVLEQREKARGHRPGLARGYYDLVHHGVAYDLTIDTTQTTPESCAREVLDAVRGRWT